MSITFSICCQYACISAYSCLSHSQHVASMLVFLLTHVYHILNMLPVRLYFCLIMSFIFSTCFQYACTSAYSCKSHSKHVSSTLVFLLTPVYSIRNMFPLRLQFCLLMFITLILNIFLVRLYFCLLMSITFSVCCQYACSSAYSCLSHSQNVSDMFVFLLTHVYHLLNMFLVRLYFCLLMFIKFSTCCQYFCISDYSCL